MIAAAEAKDPIAAEQGRKEGRTGPTVRGPKAHPRKPASHHSRKKGKWGFFSPPFTARAIGCAAKVRVPRVTPPPRRLLYYYELVEHNY